MKARCGTLMLVGAVVLAAPPARAGDGFGSPGVAISADRMFGVVASSTTQKIDGQEGEATSDATTVSLLSSPVSGRATNYSFARIAVDAFVIPGLSVGGAIGYATISTSSTLESGGVKVESDGPTLSGFLFAPRVGYAFMFMDLVGIWPRAGVTYVSASREISAGASSNEASANLLALTLEVPLVISPAPHTAILVGPTLDVGLTGGIESKTTTMGTTVTQDADQKATEFGLQAGIAIAF